MADKQVAPLPVDPGSVVEAQSAILSLLEPEEAKPETLESAPTEDVEESTEETQDEPSEEEALEAESEEDEAGEEELDEDEIEEESEVYAVKVDGEELEVTLEELVNGYSRQSDYTKKTQEISEQRKEFQELSNRYNSEIIQIQNERQQYIDGLQQALQSSLAGLDEFAAIDWEHLRQTDPIAFVTKKDEFRDAQARMQQTQYEQQMAAQKQQEDSERFRQKALVEERNHLIQKLPEWADPEKQTSMAAELKSYAGTQGFSSEEVGSLIDHRSIIVLQKAMLYDRANSSEVSKKKLKNKPKVIRAGSGNSKKSTEKAKRTARMKRLKESGHVNDSVSLFEDFVEL
jgi:hypothetical protein